MTRSSRPVIIVGGGLTGLSTALHLERPWLLLERDSSLGGLSRTEERDGFFFDVTGHWLHLRDPYVKALVEKVSAESMVSVQRRAKVYCSNVLVPYPFQANVHGLPRPAAYECLLGYVKALLGRGAEAPRNFEQYILHHFGEGIARYFLIPYNTKLWGVPPREITSAWCTRFFPVPSMEEMIAGAVGSGGAQLGYNVRFLYPRHGGIGALTRDLQSGLDSRRVRLGAEVERIDPVRQTVQVGGEELTYSALVSTMPLPELVSRLESPPAAIVEAAGRLRATSVRYLNVATRTRAPDDYHWLYVPEERLPFYRVGVFSNAVASMAPPGCSSYYVELSGREGDRQAAVADAVRALWEVRAITAVEDVLFAELREVSCAYVIFDESYEAALGQILPYLEQHRIYSCGRYGSWIYNSMEDSILAGREVAGRLRSVVASDVMDRVSHDV